MLKTIPIELATANTLVAMWHRHHQPVVGHRFSLGVIDEDGTLHGACIVGRPVARLVAKSEVVEVTRLVTDGTRNACSILYGSAARVAKAMGYQKIQTYILEEEIGSSLKATGWECEAITRGGQWTHTDGKPRRTDQPNGKKSRWSKKLNEPVPTAIILELHDPNQLDLFERAINEEL